MSDKDSNSQKDAPKDTGLPAPQTDAAGSSAAFDPEEEFRSLFVANHTGAAAAAAGAQRAPNLSALLSQLQLQGAATASSTLSVADATSPDPAARVTASGPAAAGAAGAAGAAAPTVSTATVSSSSSASSSSGGPGSAEEKALSPADVKFGNRAAVAVDPATQENSRKIVCPFCKKSVILLPGAATYVQKDIFLAYANAAAPTDGEVYSHFFKVTDKMSFENIGVRRSTGPGDAFRYLTCADCDMGPLGITFDADRNQVFYVAHRRVKYV